MEELSQHVGEGTEAMPKFAVYYVPQADQELYRLGSAVLGYDLRQRTRVETSTEPASLLGTLDPEWVSSSCLYGFHLTIGHSLYFRLGDIAKIDSEVRAIWGLFCPATQFTLTFIGASFWGLDREILVLELAPSNSVLMLHTLLTALLTPYATGSSHAKESLGVDDLEQDIHQKVKTFFNPNVLDRYKPHFTLLNPYRGRDHARLTSQANSIFPQLIEPEIRSICLVVQEREGDLWKIYREYNR